MDTIFALSSASGRAGVSVFRLSGAHSHAITQHLVRALPRLPEPRHCYFRPLIHPESGAVVDRVIVVFFDAPHSFTGEDTTELHIHGSVALQQGLPRLFALAGAAIGGDAVTIRQAERGEFIKRALLNDKTSVLEVEHLDALLQAETEAQLEIASHSQATVDFCAAIERDLIHILSQTEGVLEFPDDSLADHDGGDAGDDGDPFVTPIASSVDALHGKLRRAVTNGKKALKILRGIQLVIVGRPNVGKSSTMNALLGSDVAIASPIPGTTRDIVERRFDIEGMAVTVADTAGIHATIDPIEQEGVTRARRAIEQADVLLCLTDKDETIDEFDQALGIPSTTTAHRIYARNKYDLVTGTSTAAVRKDWLVYSATRGDRLETVQASISTALAAFRPEEEGVMMTKTRQLDAMEQSLAHIQTVQRMLANHLLAPRGANDDIELVAEELRLALLALGEVIGRYDYDHILDDLFANFCLGK